MSNLLLFALLGASIHGYEDFLYTKSVVKKLGENCLEPGRRHTSKENHDHDEGIAMELTIDIEPGYMCWFESYADF